MKIIFELEDADRQAGETVAPKPITGALVFGVVARVLSEGKLNSQFRLNLSTLDVDLLNMASALVRRQEASGTPRQT